MQFELNQAVYSKESKDAGFITGHPWGKDDRERLVTFITKTHRGIELYGEWVHEDNLREATENEINDFKTVIDDLLEIAEPWLGEGTLDHHIEKVLDKADVDQLIKIGQVGQSANTLLETHPIPICPASGLLNRASTN